MVDIPTGVDIPDNPEDLLHYLFQNRDDPNDFTGIVLQCDPNHESYDLNDDEKEILNVFFRIYKEHFWDG